LTTNAPYKPAPAKAGVPPCSLPGQPYSRHTQSYFAGITRILIAVDNDRDTGAITTILGYPTEELSLVA
jgi:hypothetical protein